MPCYSRTVSSVAYNVFIHPSTTGHNRPGMLSAYCYTLADLSNLLGELIPDIAALALVCFSGTMAPPTAASPM
jgi:hypothetical protein